MRIRIGFAAALALVVVVAFGPGGPWAAPSVTTTDNAVVHWSGVAQGAIAAGRPPGSSAVLAGMVHGAMYDAVAAVEGGLEPFATGVIAAPGASADAAVAQAARDVLIARVPGQAAAVEAAYLAYMTSLPDGLAKESGKAVGVAAAAGMLAMRSGDRFDDIVPFVQQPTGPGVFEPVAATPPVETKLPFVRPFTYDSPAEYRPRAPYELTSERYAEDLAELKTVGRIDSAVRTAMQTEAVLFYSEQTFVQFSRTLRELANERGLDLRESARLFGYYHVAAADTMIACFDAKYYYSLWRPQHAIQRADTDGNPATTADGSWLPRLTVNHPEYPSGHSCFTAAFTESLRNYFGTKQVRLVISSTVVGAGPARTYESVDDLVADVENARVWAGLHYRTTMIESAKHYPQIAHDIGKQYFLVKDKGTDKG